MRILKFPINVNAQSGLAPKGAQLLSIQVQQGVIFAWYLTDENETETERRDFVIIGTGHKFSDHGPFITTVQLEQGTLVLHIFEGKAEPSKEPLVKKKKYIDAFNKFAVALSREDVVILNPPKPSEQISKDEAIGLAVWLLILAGDIEFENAKLMMEECLN